jgi:hypothetical protein
MIFPDFIKISFGFPRISFQFLRISSRIRKISFMFHKDFSAFHYHFSGFQQDLSISITFRLIFWRRFFIDFHYLTTRIISRFTQWIKADSSQIYGDNQLGSMLDLEHYSNRMLPRFVLSINYFGTQRTSLSRRISIDGWISKCSICIWRILGNCGPIIERKSSIQNLWNERLFVPTEPFLTYRGNGFWKSSRNLFYRQNYFEGFRHLPDSRTPEKGSVILHFFLWVRYPCRDFFRKNFFIENIWILCL